MAKKKQQQPVLPFSAPGRHKPCVVDVPSFTKGLITLVPSDVAGQMGAQPTGGVPMSPQVQTVIFGKDSKDAVVVASNVRFRDKSTMAAPGYQKVLGLPDGLTPVTFVQQMQAQAKATLIVGTSTDLYIAQPIS